MKTIIFIFKLFISSICLIIFSHPLTYSQVNQEWVVRYNSPFYSANANCVAVDGFGNVYVSGTSFVSNTEDYTTIKYNSSGVQEWLARYNGPTNNIDYPYSIAVDNSGNVYVSGTSFASGTYDDYATVKYNSSGVQQWVQDIMGQLVEVMMKFL